MSKGLCVTVSNGYVPGNGIAPHSYPRALGVFNPGCRLLKKCFFNFMMHENPAGDRSTAIGSIPWDLINSESQDMLTKT